MRCKKNRFLDILESYVTEYMPYAAGLSGNTIRSYKDTFRLLLTILSAFAAYAQNRDFDAASVFMNSIQKIPAKRTEYHICFFQCILHSCQNLTFP